MTETVENEIKAIIAEVSGADESEILPDASLVKDLEIDSIKAIEIIVAIEKKFKISVRDEEVPKITTVKQAIDLVNSLLGAGRNAGN